MLSGLAKRLRFALCPQRDQGAQERGARRAAAAPGPACSRPRRSAAFGHADSRGPRCGQCRSGPTGRRWRIVPSSSSTLPAKDLAHRVHHKQRQQGRHNSTAPATKASPLKSAQTCYADAEQRQQAHQQHHARPSPCPAGVRSDGACQCSEPIQVPAQHADGKSAGDQPSQTQASAAAQQQPWRARCMSGYSGQACQRTSPAMPAGRARGVPWACSCESSRWRWAAAPHTPGRRLPSGCLVAEKYQGSSAKAAAPRAAQETMRGGCATGE